MRTYFKRRVPRAPIIAVDTNDADEPVAALTPLEDRCSNRGACQFPLPFHSLSHPERKDFCDRAAEVAVKRPELLYLAAAGVVAAQFNVKRTCSLILRRSLCLKLPVLVLKSEWRPAKLAKITELNRGRREVGREMLTLGFQHLLPLFFPCWKNAFSEECNMKGWDLEGRVAFTKYQLWKLRGKQGTSWTTRTSSGNPSSRASQVSTRALGLSTEQQQPLSTPRDVNPLKLPADVKDVVQAAKTDILPLSRALHADFDVGAEHAPAASDQAQAPAGTDSAFLQSLLADNLKLREWVKVMSGYLEAASRDEQADVARQRGRVSAKDMWNQVGSATGDASIANARARAGERKRKADSAFANKQAAASKRRETAAESCANGVELLKQIWLSGPDFIIKLKAAGLRDLIQASNPQAPPPKGLKEAFLAKVFTLTKAKQALAGYAATQSVLSSAGGPSVASRHGLFGQVAKP
eukprot:jgi/Tetstr1/458649/TSEL_045042.t1